MSNQTRRDFLEQSLFAAFATAFAGAPAVSKADDAPKKSVSPNDRLQLALVGAGGRGEDHIHSFGRLPDCEFAAVVDVDEAAGHRSIERIKDKTGKAPEYYRDLRQMLEDKSIDIVSIATPNHWHSLAAIWAMQAGKDVYVEKPVSHNVSEGRRLVQTARKTGKIVPDRHADADRARARRKPSNYVQRQARSARCKLRPRPVLQDASLDRSARETPDHSQSRRLQPLVRTGADEAPHAPQPALRLALDVGLRQRRPGQPGHPSDGRLPLGAGCR